MSSTFELLQRLRPHLASSRTPVFVVGGALRDFLLGREAYDLDFTLAEGAISLAFSVADALGAPAFALDRERDIGRVVLDPQTVLDFARFRGPDLEADLRARDFTVNALALDCTELPHEPPLHSAQQAIVDPTGGLADLQAGILRQTHAGAIADDPVRALRAVRLSRQLDLQLEGDTSAAARSAAAQLHETSVERVRDEFLKIMRGPEPQRALSQMHELTLLQVVVPEIAALHGVQQSAPHHEPVLAHTFSLLGHLPQVEAALVPQPGDDAAGALALGELLAPYAAALRAHLDRPVDGAIDGRAVLRLAALFHDVGKAVTASHEADGRIRFLGHDKEGAAITARRLRALRLSKEAIGHVQRAVAAHMRPLHLATSLPPTGRISRRAAYRFFRQAADAGLDVSLLTLADHLATFDGAGPPEAWAALRAVVDQLLGHYFERYEETVAPPPLLHGGELMAALKLQPGPQIGRLLRQIEEAQAAGEISTAEEALALARKRLQKGR